MNDLVVFERQLQPIVPHFEQALGGIMPVARLVRTLLYSCERNPKLLQANRQSLLNAGMTFAVLALEIDGVTGQGYLLPFKVKGELVVQPCIGYRGYNTLAARAYTTISGEVVREGDTFEYELGTKQFVRHLPRLDGAGRITAAWACAVSANRPPSIVVLGRRDIDAVMQKSPAVRGGFDTPWNDTLIGFPAMSAKTAKRRLSRSMPLTVFQLAARMDEAFEEQGKLSWIAPDNRVMIEGEVAPLAPLEASETPSISDLIPAGEPTPRTSPTPAGSAAPDSPLSGAATPDPLVTVAQLKAEIDGLGTKRAHVNWARNMGSTLEALPMRQQHEVVNYYENHKERATA